jgi:hypothetical protein
LVIARVWTTALGAAPKALVVVTGEVSMVGLHTVRNMLSPSSRSQASSCAEPREIFFRRRGTILPAFRELARPWDVSPVIGGRLAEVDPDEAHPLNLFRVHWYNAANRRDLVRVPEHLELPPALTGVKARILGYRAVAMLPEGMSAELERDPDNIVLNHVMAHGLSWPKRSNARRSSTMASANTTFRASRQARPVHPQRHEHRLRDRRFRSCDRRALTQFDKPLEL